MSLVRLQCPSCASIVKIHEEVAAQYPVVRCAKCQGLVTVATSKVAEPPLTEQEVSSFRPKKKKKRSSQAGIPLGMIAGILVGILVLAGAGFGLYFLISSLSGSPLDKAFKQLIAQANRMADAIEGIKTPDDVGAAFDTVTQCLSEVKTIVEKNQLSNEKVDEEEGKRILEKYTPELMKLQTRMQTAFMKLATRPELAQALQMHAAKLGGNMLAGLGGLAALGNAFNQGGKAPGLPNFGKNQPPANFNQSDSSLRGEGKPARLVQLLLAKSSQVSLIPTFLNEIQDAASAERAMYQLEGLLDNISISEQELQKLMLEQGKPADSAGRKAIVDISKVSSDVYTHMSRIEKHPDLGSYVARLTTKLKAAGLIAPEANFGSAASSTKNDTNPFEPSGSGNKPGTSGSNPFEPAGSGGKPIRSGGTGGTMESTLAKLTSSEHFKKLEGLREAQAARLEESSKTAVLDALLALLEDSDIHQKHDVLKAFKKWATTQQEKERLGEHVETLLKDPFAKKDALRFFGENKVVSAGKEIARLLKDNFDRKDAAEALIALGSGAESAVIPHLTDLEPQVRHMAIEVLARIGTELSVPELQKLRNDRFVGRAASQAITLINSRKNK